MEGMSLSFPSLQSASWRNLQHGDRGLTLHSCQLQLHSQEILGRAKTADHHLCMFYQYRVQSSSTRMTSWRFQDLQAFLEGGEEA
jgi:hypothetical protein